MNGRRGTTFSKGKAKNAKYTLNLENIIIFVNVIIC